MAAQIGAMQTSTQQAVAAIGGISGVVKQMDRIAGGISAAVEQQRTATQEIARGAQEAAARTQEVSATSPASARPRRPQAGLRATCWTWHASSARRRRRCVQPWMAFWGRCAPLEWSLTVHRINQCARQIETAGLARRRRPLAVRAQHFQRLTSKRNSDPPQWTTGMYAVHVRRTRPRAQADLVWPDQRNRGTG
jgi:hypothetical protein